MAGRATLLVRAADGILGTHRTAEPASRTAARGSGKAGGRSRELIVPLLDLARLLFPETRSEQESQLRCGWHDLRHPQVLVCSRWFATLRAAVRPWRPGSGR